MKNKYIFVITDGTVNTTGRSVLDEYLSAQQRKALCFVAPEISLYNEIAQPKHISKENSLNVVFYNLKYPMSDLSSKINAINCMSRIYNSPETIETYNFLTSKKVNFIALDNFRLFITSEQETH